VVLRDHCDGLIVGSAVVRCLEAGGSVAEMQAKVTALARTLRAALDEG
jgi:tryptophan synthase alpha subunit